MRFVLKDKGNDLCLFGFFSENMVKYFADLFEREVTPCTCVRRSSTRINCSFWGFDYLLAIFASLTFERIVGVAIL
jgi:hypothetical protein